MSSRLRRGIAAVVCAVMATPAVADALPSNLAERGRPTGAPGPTATSYVQAAAYSWLHPGAAVPGTNVQCTPQPGQIPVVLIPGTGEDAYATWAGLAQQLHDEGLCVYTFNHNPAVIHGRPIEPLAFSGDIRESAAMLAEVVQSVLAETGAHRVNLVGHSQGGGPLPHWYLTRLGGERYVDQLIALAPSNNGANPMGASEFMDRHDGMRHRMEERLAKKNMHAWSQQLRGSELLEELHSGPLTRDSVRYTVLASRYDTTVSPPESSFIDEPGVRNVYLQDIDPTSRASHFDLPYDASVVAFVFSVLADS